MYLIIVILCFVYPNAPNTYSCQQTAPERQIMKNKEFIKYQMENNLNKISPVAVYSNASLQKKQILQDNKGKSGIYKWKNSINNKWYIGSSENLNRRFSEYFNVNYLLKNSCMVLCRALLKHGYSNFSLTIIEYCNKEKCIEREKYYIDLLGSEYNTVKDTTLPPMSARKHSEETKQILSDTNKGKKNPYYGKNHSDETKQKMSDIKKGKKIPSGSCKPSQQIEVTDLELNITTNYNSINEAARALNINQTVIVKYFTRNQQKPYKGQYTFKKL